MAKVTAPLFGFDSRGQIGKAIVYSMWKGVSYVRRYIVPANPNTADQQAVRSLMTDASQAWSTGATVGSTTIDAAYKLAYATAASGQQYSGFNLYMKDCVALNGGSNYSGTLELPTEPGDITPA